MAKQSKNQVNMIDYYRELSGSGEEDPVHVVVFWPELGQLLKDPKAGLILSQFLYWTKINSENDGWFYDSNTDLTYQTSLTKREQKRARDLLVERGLVEIKLASMPHRFQRVCWYRVNTEALKEAIIRFRCSDVSLLQQNVAATNGSSNETLQQQSVAATKRHSLLVQNVTHSSNDSSPSVGTFATNQEYKTPDKSLSEDSNKTTTTYDQAGPGLGGGGDENQKEIFNQVFKSIGVYKRLWPEYMRIAYEYGFTPEGIENLFTQILDEVQDRKRAIQLLKFRLQNESSPTVSSGYTNGITQDEPQGETVDIGFLEYEGHNAQENLEWICAELAKDYPAHEDKAALLQGCEGLWWEEESGEKTLRAFCGNSIIYNQVKPIEQFCQAVASKYFRFEILQYP